MAKSLLVADDSATIHKMVELSFTQENVTVSGAKSVSEALAHARSHRPDVILADTFMPERNGYDLAAAVQADGELAGIPVVLLVSANEPFDEARARAVGAAGWVNKPFQSAAIIEQVRKVTSAPAAVPVAAPPVSVPPPVREPTPGPPRNLVSGVATAISPAIRVPPPMPGDVSVPPPPRHPPMTAPVSPDVPTVETILPTPLMSEASLPPVSRPPASRPPASVPPVSVPPASIPPVTIAVPVERTPAPAPVAAPPTARPRPYMPPVPPAFKLPGPRGSLTALSQEAALKELLSTATKEMIEKVVWEVVPELAETMIKEEIDRLTKQKQAG